MRLNRKDSYGRHITEIRAKARVMSEERPSAFMDTLDADEEVSEMADRVIRQNQIINRALRRQYRSRISRKAI
jgi:hypothetical protein